MRSTEAGYIVPVGADAVAGAASLDAFWDAQRSTLVRNILGTAAHVAMSDLGVRIVGERGSGKTQLARLIHGRSSRSEFVFKHIACARIQPDSAEEAFFGMEGTEGGAEGALGFIEASRGGTLYLDDYHALNEELRFRLWKAMELKHMRRVGGSQDVSVDVRVITGIAKTSAFPAEYQNSDAETARKISPVCINIPPLRERKDDIDSLIYLFLEEYSRSLGKNVMGITPRALEYCRYYDWPGNIYELRTVIHQCAARSGDGPLDVPDLPEYLGHRYSLRTGDPIR